MTQQQKKYFLNLIQELIGDVAAFLAVITFIGITLGLIALAVLAPLSFLLEAAGR